MEKFPDSESKRGRREEDSPQMNRRQFLRNAAGIASLGAIGVAGKMLAPESFTADKKVQKAVAETNSNIQTFTQIADEWKPLAEDIISRYPLEKSTGKVSFKGVGAYYKNFSEIRQALNDVLYFTYQFEKYQKEFAAALAEMDKEKTLMLHGEMQKNLDSLQEYVLHASRVPGMNDFIAEHLEGQRSA